SLHPPPAPQPSTSILTPPSSLYARIWHNNPGHLTSDQKRNPLEHRHLFVSFRLSHRPAAAAAVAAVAAAAAAHAAFVAAQKPKRSTHHLLAKLLALLGWNNPRDSTSKHCEPRNRIPRTASHPTCRL